DGHAVTGRDSDPVPATFAVVDELVAGHREGHDRCVRVAELGLLHEQQVRLGPGQPLVHGILPGLERVDVPGRDAHGATQYRRPRWRPQADRAATARAMTAIVPAWTGSLTTRSTCSVIEPTIFRAMIGMPTARSSSAATLMSPPMIEQ